VSYHRCHGCLNGSTGSHQMNCVAMKHIPMGYGVTIPMIALSARIPMITSRTCPSHTATGFMRYTLLYPDRPYSAITYPTLLYPTLPYPAHTLPLPYHALLHLPYPILLYPTLPYSSLPYHTLHYTTLHYTTRLYPTLPYSTLPYPTLEPTYQP
jgi:hypothetical protein